MSDVTNYPTLSQVVGRNLRSIREAHGWRQEDLAKRSRDYGLGWNRATVAAVETGQRSLADGELSLLAFMLVVGFDELLAGDGAVRLASDATAELSAVRALHCGYDVGSMKPGVLDVPVTRKLRAAAQRFRTGERTAMTEQVDRLRRLWPKARMGDLVDAENAMDDETVKKAARKLGVDPLDVALVALKLWGRDLPTERDARVAETVPEDASARTRQALRGHVTRALLAELAPELNTKG